jgi:hypothetical protein
MEEINMIIKTLKKKVIRVMTESLELPNLPLTHSLIQLIIL